MAGMRHTRFVFLAMLSGLLILLSACTAQTAALEPTHTPTRQGQLIAFHTATPSSTPTPVDLTTPTPLPSPTPTMRSHVIARGQDLGGIAFRYRVSLQALLEANPDVNPYFLVVGSSLNIPPSTEAPEETPAPTPVAVQIGPVHCSADRDGGAWCFTLVTNPHNYAVESITAVIRLADEQARIVVSQTAAAPLDLLPSHGSMPLAVYFPARLPPAPRQASAELLTSLPVYPDDERYLPVEVKSVTVEIGINGLEAEVEGDALIQAEEGTAGLLRLAVVAYDEDENVIGLRRWEMEQPLPAGIAQPISLRVYSTGGEIKRVEVLAEARQINDNSK
jgi:LysM repeat protein